MLVFHMYGKLLNACLLILTAAAIPPQSRGWRDFVPLHSTRAEVERLLGPPTTDRGHITFYEFEKERILFEYVKNTCGDKFGGWNVPRDTVVSIRVTPKPNTMQFNDLNLERSKFRQERNKEVGSIIHYIDEAGGVVYDVELGGDVTSIRYYPAAKDAHLYCPPSVKPLDDTTKFVSYSDIPFDREKKLLDSFAAQLRQYDSATGYIMSYAGRRARVGEAKARAERAKKYLTQVRGIDGRRVVPIDGGYRDKPTVELYLVPPGTSPPLATPTVDPREVRIIKPRSRRNRGSKFQSGNK